MKNKVLVYDSTGGYARFIKLYFKSEIVCESFFDYKFENDIDYDDFSALFFFVNDPMQLSDLLLIYKKFNLAFLATRLPKFSQSLKSLDNAVIIDLQQSRPEMIKFIRGNLKLFGVTKEL